MTDVAAIRGRKGWSQKELAEYLGVHPSTVSRMESSGRVDRRTAKLLDRIEQEQAGPERPVGADRPQQFVDEAAQ